MPKRIALTNLNGRTIDILNAIRANASYAYQSEVPALSDANGIPAVGEVLYGNPTLCNEFINALVNRIALVVVNSAVFNNPFVMLKKGYLEFGESVEEIFVKIAQVQEFSAEKAEAREFKRTIPDVESAFHTMNWRVLYPVTIQREDLRRAFLSADGVENLVTMIIEQIYTAANYDEFLLVKYMLIKAISAGKAYPTVITTTGSNMDSAAVAFRGASNTLQFMKTAYNEAGVLTNTPKDRQYIIMDANFNARFDVEVLAGAFNMDKADFMGRLILIDDWNTFDNARWTEIRANSDMVEEVSDAELTLMESVHAVLVDERWFQIYDNEAVMTDQRVASGLYWNYFYHVWKTVSHSPFSNIIAFVEYGATVGLPATIAFEVAAIETSEVSTIITLQQKNSDTLQNTRFKFVQTDALTADGVAVHEYGAYIVPVMSTPIEVIDDPTLEIDGVTYVASDIQVIADDTVGSEVPAVAVGDTITFAKSV